MTTYFTQGKTQKCTTEIGYSHSTLLTHVTHRHTHQQITHISHESDETQSIMGQTHENANKWHVK